MNVIDKAEFDQQFAVLCAGLNAIPSTERLAAYWRGLSAMSLSSFARVVDFCLSERGPEKLPTVSAVWRMYRELRAAPAPARQQEAATWTRAQAINAHGNLRLLTFLLDQGAASSESLAELLDAKARVCADLLQSDKHHAITAEWANPQFADAYRVLWRPMSDEDASRTRQAA